MRVVLALAGNFLREWFRRRSTYVLMAVLALAVLWLASAGAGAAGSAEAARLLVEYGLGLPSFFIALVSISQAAAIAREIESQRAQVAATRPVAAWQVVCGRVVGIAAADVVLLSLVLVVLGTYAARRLAGDPAGQLGAGMARILAPRGELAAVHTPPAEEDVQALVRSLQGELRPGEPADVRTLELRARRALGVLRLGPGDAAELRFEGLATHGSGRLDAALPVRFTVFSLSPGESPRVEVRCAAVAPESGEQRPLATREAIHGIAVEIEAPAAMVDAGGALRIIVAHAGEPGSDPGIVLDPAKARALPARGTFAGSLLAGACLFLVQWALLVSVALMLGVMFRFATAVLAGVVLAVAAFAAGFLRETFDLFAGAPAAGTLTERFAAWGSRLGEVVLRAIPDFSRVDPVERLGAGRTIQWGELASETAWHLGVVALPALVAASLCLSRRELGKV